MGRRKAMEVELEVDAVGGDGVAGRIGSSEGSDAVFVYEIRNVFAVIGEERYALREYVALSGVPPTGFTRFCAEVQVKVAMTPQGPVVHTEEVVLEGDGLRECALYLQEQMPAFKAAIKDRGKKLMIKAQLEQSALAARGPLSQELGRGAAAHQRNGKKRRR